MKHIHTLTGLRGLGALIVFIAHASRESILPAFLGDGLGQTGVMIFFVLSGFLMAHLYIHQEFDGINVRRYALARIGRVFPLYFSMLAISLIFTYIIPFDAYCCRLDDMNKLARALLLIDAPYVFWTIPVEVQFYVVFIGFWLCYKKGLGPHYLAGFILMTMLPSVIVYATSSKIPNVVSAYSYAFFLGVTTALTFNKLKNNSTVRKIAAVAGLPALLLIFINLPEVRQQYGLSLSDNFYIRTWCDPVTWAIVYLFFICVLLNSQGVAILNHRPLVYLGEISYGFYLIHYPVLLYIAKEVPAPAVLKLVLAFVVTVLMAHLSFHYFERPAAKKIRGLAA